MIFRGSKKCKYVFLELQTDEFFRAQITVRCRSIGIR